MNKITIIIKFKQNVHDVNISVDNFIGLQISYDDLSKMVLHELKIGKYVYTVFKNHENKIVLLVKENNKFVFEIQINPEDLPTLFKNGECKCEAVSYFNDFFNEVNYYLNMYS